MFRSEDHLQGARLFLAKVTQSGPFSAAHNSHNTVSTDLASIQLA